MDQAVFLERLQFGFTVTFHYLFPELTMGLAPLIVVRARLQSALRRSAALALLMLATFLCTERASAQAARPVLRWGGDAEGGAPFVEADPADPARVRGFDVEIAAMMAHGLGREPLFVQVAWSSIEASVERGDF